MRFDEKYFKEKVLKMFNEKNEVVDIGGGLKIDPAKNNRSKRNEWAIEASKGKYKVLDKVPDYNPDMVGDIQKLPFKDNSIESILCLDVLEHVEEPWTACRELYRVLNPGGYLLVRVPFIFYYHPEKGYYEDFYRFTPEGLKYLLKDFKKVEITNIRGALGTVMNMFPFFSKKTQFFDLLDRLTGKDKSGQSSGFYAWCVK